MHSINRVFIQHNIYILIITMKIFFQIKLYNNEQNNVSLCFVKKHFNGIGGFDCIKVLTSGANFRG